MRASNVMQIAHEETSLDISLFRDLEFLKKTGNFSQAATLANISQPAYSRRIQGLESWVGTTLVDRSRQPASLTDAGQQMLESGLQALQWIEQTRNQILESEKQQDNVVITFGAQHSIGWRFFPAWLQAFEIAYGPIQSRFRAEDLPDCLRELDAGDVDFVIAYERAGKTISKAYESIAIGTDQLIPVCKPAANGGPLYLFDSANVSVPYLRFGQSAPIAAHLAPLFKQYRIGRQLRMVYENSMAGALHFRARAGDGVAWLPRSLVAPDLANGLLVQAGEKEWTVDLSIRMLRNQSVSNQTSDSIWSFLKEHEAEELTLL